MAQGHNLGARAGKNPPPLTNFFALSLNPSSSNWAATQAIKTYNNAVQCLSS